MVLKKYKYIYMLLFPAMLLTLIFHYLPMLGIVMAFQDFDIFKGFFRSEFVGWDNFIEIFTLPQFIKAILNTLLFSSVILFVGFPLPILLALLFNELRSVLFKRVVQTVTYLPYFLSWISVVTLFYALPTYAGDCHGIPRFRHI